MDTGFAFATQHRTDAEKFIFRAERSLKRGFLVGDYEDVAGETEHRAVGDEAPVAQNECLTWDAERSVLEVRGRLTLEFSNQLFGCNRSIRLRRVIIRRHKAGGCPAPDERS